MIPSVEAIIFRYVSKEDSSSFSSQMEKWGIRLVQSTQTSQPQVVKTTLLEKWDYPFYRVEKSDPSNFVKRVAELEHFKLGLSRLENVTVISIDPVPDHYPFRYVLAYHFRVISTDKPINEKSLFGIISDSTNEIKNFTDLVWQEAKYRPIFWFVVGLPKDSGGIIGVLNSITSPNGTEIEVERGFPLASYIIYGSSPMLEDFKVADLALISVVAHLVERSYRRRLDELQKKIEERTPSTPPDEIKKLFESVSKLERKIRDSYLKQNEIRPLIKDYYETRRNLVRDKGLVLRVKQKCGALTQKKNLFDVVCDDAITVLDEEIGISLEEVDQRVKGVRDSLGVVFDQLSNQRSQKLQSIGYLLESTGIAFVVFQILTGLPPWTALLPDILVRYAVTLLLVVFSGFFSYTILERILK